MTPHPRPLPAGPGAVALLALVAMLAGCGTPAPSDADAPASTQPAASAPSAAASRPAPSPSAASPSAPATPRPIADDPGAVAIEVVAEGLAAPIGFATAPDGMLLVQERDGRVLVLDPATGERSVFLDITDRVRGGGEQGLLGVALHPGWPDVAEGFVHYSDLRGDTVVSRFSAAGSSTPPGLDPASEEILLQVEQPFPNHNGGQLAFGPDGLLYIGLGDGGSGGDPFGNGQNPETLLGTILRVDVSADGAGYAIPDANPFPVGAGGAPEVLFTGLRNPWRFSFDPETGLLWIADVGQNAWEEVNRLDPGADAGANLGWNVMEAAHCFTDPSCATDGLHLPIAEYGHDVGCSVTGGAVYRGDAIPGLWGWYVFSDYCGGMLFAIPSDAEAPAGGALAPVVLLEPGLSVSAFGVDASGELLIADVAAGTIYRIVGG